MFQALFVFALVLSTAIPAQTFSGIFDKSTSDFEQGIAEHATRSRAEATVFAALSAANANLSDGTKLDLAMEDELKIRLQALFDALHGNQNSKPLFSTLGDLNLLFQKRKQDANGQWLTEEELYQLASRLMIQTERRARPRADLWNIVRDLAQRQLDTLEQLGVGGFDLTDKVRANLGLQNGATLSEVKNAIQNRKLDPKNAYRLLTDLLKSTVDNASLESLSSAFRPQHIQLFNGLVAKHGDTLPLPTYGDAIDRLGTDRTARAGGWFSSPVPETFLIPQLPEPGAGLAGGVGQQGRSFFIGGSSTPAQTERLAAVGDELACLKSIREGGYNVELALPGALCGSSNVTFNHEDRTCSPGERARRYLRTARHCLYGMDLRGRNISINTPLGEVPARVIHLINPDQRGGTPIQENNPDSAILEVELSCEAASSLRPFRIATEADFRKLREKSPVAVAIGQNRHKNAQATGQNRGVLLANARLNHRSNFIGFNSGVNLEAFDGSRFPANASTRGDSAVTQPGDSGSFVAACVRNADRYEPVSIGSVSHIEIRNDGFSGKVGGIASSQNDSAFFAAAFPSSALISRALAGSITGGH